MSQPAAPSPTVARWTLVATILASSMAFIDSSALNVAIPALQTDLNATGSQVFWVVNGYSLFLASLILVGGTLGDLYGRNRIFRAGIILFSLASLACGLAPNVTVLIIARAVQGIGGALMVPGSLAIISAIFQSQRGKAIGTWSMFSTVTTIAGPILGGWMAENGLWRGVFLINLPLAAIALYALTRVPETKDANARALDIPGAVLATLGLAGLTFGLLQGPELGFSDPLILITLVGGIVALIAFVVWQTRSPHPMVPLSLFKNRTFSGTNALTLFLYGALSGSLFFVPLNMIQVQGYDSAIAGFTLIPFAVLLTVLSRWSGGWVDKIGARIPLTVGPALTGVGFLLFSFVGLTGGASDYWTTFFPAIVIMGIGMGITVAPLTTAVMSSAPSEASGTASGINNAVARTAGVLAIAIFGALAILSFSASLEARTVGMEMDEEARQVFMTEEAPKLAAAAPPEGVSDDTAAQITDSVRQSFVETYRTLMLISAGMAFVSALMGWLLVEGKKAADLTPESAVQTEAT